MIIGKVYVDGCINWFSPENVSFSAIPNAFVDMTDIDPTAEHIKR